MYRYNATTKNTMMLFTLQSWNKLRARIINIRNNYNCKYENIMYPRQEKVLMMRKTFIENVRN